MTRVEAASQGCPFSTRAAAFDPFEDAFQQDPPDAVRWSRDDEPVFFSPKLGYWVVTRYDDVKAVFRDNIAFSPSIALEKITPTGEEANAVLASYGFAIGRTLVNEDEPAHMPRRRALMDPFAPAQVRLHEPLVRQLTREYVDRFVDDGRVDLVDRMLWEVPLTVALHFLGIPEEDMPTLRHYSIAHTVNTWGRPRPDEQVAVAHAVGNFWQYAGKVLDKMRQDPSGPGWMRYGIREQMELPEVVTDSYLHSMMMAGIVAAHETTANASANALKVLLQHPTAWRELCEDPSLIPNAVEECLRHNGSIAAWRRITTCAATVGGVALPAGARLLIVTASANRDEHRFDGADLFDIHRDDAGEHLTFGFGAHRCLGQELARMEMQVFLQELTRRLPHMRLAPQTFSYLPNTSFRGPEHLWVEWSPQDNPERRDPSVRNVQVPVRIGNGRGELLATRDVMVDRVTRLADDVVALRLVAIDGGTLPHWTPGAHIDVDCRRGGSLGRSPGAAASARWRSYSLCGDPTEQGAMSIAVRLAVDGRGGSSWLHRSVLAGDRLSMRGPRNRFHFDEQARRAIFIAGGIGITPIVAMARRALALGIDYELHYCGNTRARMPFLDSLVALHGDRLRLHVGDEAAPGGRARLASLLALPPETLQVNGTRIYACGPTRMLDAIEALCEDWPVDTLRTERFTAGSMALDASREHGFEVVLKGSGRVIPVTASQTLLCALRAADIDIRSDCEEGLCGSCEVQVLDGEVDHRDRVLTRAEQLSNRKMMACCSRARGQRLLLAL